MALGPALYWRLDEPSSGYSVTDASGNGRHGSFGGEGSISHSQTGSVDSDAATQFPVGLSNYAKATTYQPFVQGSQRTFCGIYYGDAGYTAGAFELFAGDGANNVHPALEVFPTTGRMLFFSNTASFLTTVWPRGTWPGFDSWVFWVLTYDATTQTPELFINGNSVGGGYGLRHHRRLRRCGGAVRDRDTRHRRHHGAV